MNTKIQKQECLYQYFLIPQISYNYVIYLKMFYERWEEILLPSLSCSSYSAMCPSDNQDTDMQMLLGKVSCCRV